MTRSQRHRVKIENYASNGMAIAQGAIAPGYLLQMPGPYTVPMGPPGGPLSGSSLSGPAPASFPQPHEEETPPPAPTKQPAAPAPQKPTVGVAVKPNVKRK